MCAFCLKNLSMEIRIKIFEILENEKCYKEKYKDYLIEAEKNIFNTVDDEVDCFKDSHFEEICQKLPLIFKKIESSIII